MMTSYTRPLNTAQIRLARIVAVLQSADKPMSISDICDALSIRFDVQLVYDRVWSDMRVLLAENMVKASYPDEPRRSGVTGRVFTWVKP